MNKRESRRSFHGKVALLAAAPLLAPASAARADENPPRDPQAATLQALMDIIRHRYGKHLNAEQLDRVRRQVQIDLLIADRLRRFPLREGSEPAFVFQADVE
jgi:hypothetical protein